MTSSKKSLLDLFMPITTESALDPVRTEELLAMAHETLASIDPKFQTKGCKIVLDELETRKQFVMHDLAVLCYEAISYIEKRTGRS